MKNHPVNFLIPVGPIAAALFVILSLIGCDLDTGDTITGPPPVTPDGILNSSFQGDLTPVAAADDGICRVLLVATTTGGEGPYGFLWSAESLVAAASTVQGYPNTGTVSIVLPPTFGAVGGSVHIIKLRSGDQTGAVDDASASEPINCAGAVVVPFTGG